MTFQQAKDSALVGFTGIGVGILAWMAYSVMELNVNIAKVVTKVDAHETRIEKLEGKTK